MLSQKSVTENLSELPSPPIVIQRLHRIISEQDPGIKEVSQIIETDPAFTAKVLRLVNSPFYGVARRVSSVSDAITILGFNSVHQLLLTTSILDVFKTGTGAVNIDDFWKHSFGVGAIAKNLLFRKSQDYQNEAFICGILHDIGRLLYVKADPKMFGWFYFERQAVCSIEDEKEHFGIDHQEVGRLLAQKWNFPENVIEVITKHHVPETAEKYPMLVATVNIANMLCHAMQIGSNYSNYVTEFHTEAWQKLDLTWEQLEKCLRGAMVEIGHSEELLRNMQ